MMIPIEYLIGVTPRDRQRVELFKAALRDGVKFSPLRVQRSGERRWVVRDGAHRLLALRQLGRTTAECETEMSSGTPFRRPAPLELFE